MSDITIVMSVFNGSKYLEQQLSSLEMQNYTDWNLIVRDNGSTDNTYDILEKFQKRLGEERIELIREKSTIREVYNSFMDLMDRVKSEYCMFCDGDDFWLPGKINNAFEAIKKMETSFGKSLPLLYHTDLILTDYKLTPKFLSMWASQRLYPIRNSPIQCLMHSSSIGNTFIFNRALMEIAKNRPNDVIMHDIYCSTIAALFGRISYSIESQILYRQHSENICGGESFYNLKNLWKKFNAEKIKVAIYRKSLLAAEILKLHGDQMKQNDVEIFMIFSNIADLGWFRRRISYIKAGAYLNGLVRNFGLFLFG
jgi:glycosyltransferase involved in cell wall biosynthesis